MKSNTVKDGFGISLTFAGLDVMLGLDPTSIKPPGIDGGEPIEMTYAFNSDGTERVNDFKLFHPRGSVTYTPIEFTAYYDPTIWDTIVAAINKNCVITVGLPDGSGIEIYGYLKSFEPNEFVEGEPPTAEAEIVITNLNGSAEIPPALVEPE